MKAFLVLPIAAALLLPTGIGCGGGSNEPTSIGGSAQIHSRSDAQRQAAKKRRAVRRHRARIRAHRAAIRRAHRAAARQHHAEEAQARQQALMEQREQAEVEALQAEEEAASECDPNYAGACLDPYSSDYDCAGGSGNGPDYTGEVAVVGEDHYGLDADSDGVGCEPY